LKIFLIIKKIFNALGILFIYEATIKGFSYLISHLFEGNFILILSIVIPVTFIMRYLAIKFYDKREEDSIGIEAIKSKSLSKKETLVAKILRFLLKIGKFAAYLIVAIDSTATVIYFRKGSKLWNGIPDRKTWVLFILSNIICSITIILACLGILKIF
jgi:hypothetical protein